MRRDLASIPGVALVLSLSVGCAEDGAASDSASEASATNATQSSTTASAESTTSSAETTTSSATTASTSAGPVPTTTSEETTTPATSGPGETDGSTTSGVDGSSETGDPEPGSTTSTSSAGETTGADTEAPLSFAADVWPLLEGNCGCHEDANGAGNLHLAMEDAYTNIVDVPSDDLPMMMLVAPGSPETSYLWHKMNNTQKSVDGKGKRMPPDGLLDMADLDIIQQWIEQGAKP